MKARLEAGKVVKYNKIPKVLTVGGGLMLNANSLSDDSLKAQGFLDVVIPQYDTDTQSINNLHLGTSTDLEGNTIDVFTYDVVNKTFLVTLEEAKLEKLEELRALTHSLLSETDWYITRKVELDIDIPSAVSSAREAIRTSHDSKDNAIFALTTIPEVLNYSL